MTATRREFVQSSLALAFPIHADDAVPIIDTHTHFYDPTRKEGVPWPGKNDEMLYRKTMPAEFEKLAKPLGVVGTVVVEASPWLEDNQWILDLAKDDPFIVGFVGNLKVGDPKFGEHLARFARNPLFRGIRINGPVLRGIAQNKDVLAELKKLSETDLALDLLGGPEMLADVDALAGLLPTLRIVIDHLPYDMPVDPKAAKDFGENLDRLAKRESVFAKVSNVLRRVDDNLRSDGEHYRKTLDQLWKLFGPERVIYGSNWPVSNRVAAYADVLKIAVNYLVQKDIKLRRSFFAGNAKAAYKWIERKL